MSFSDSDKFRFIEIDVQGGSNYLIPVHYRELGEKAGLTYDKKVSWCDIVINGVPLEKSFEYEDQIQDIISEKKSFEDPGIIIVNERKNKVSYQTDLDDYDSKDYSSEKKRWLNRLKRIGYPFNYREAKKKKKKSQGKYPVKPKEKRILHPQKQIEFLNEEESKEEFEDLKDCITRIGTEEYEDATIYIDEDESSCECGWGPGVTWFKKRRMITYCPPLHWIKPIVQWKKIWIEMDSIEFGKRRDYHYISPDECDENGKPGPMIFFYEKDSDDLNYNFDYCTDYISSPSKELTTPFPYKY